MSAIKINSHIAMCGCARIRASGTRCFLFSTARTLRREIDKPAIQRLVPRLPEQQSTQQQLHAAAVHGEQDDTRRLEKKKPLCLSVAPATECSWPSWQASLPSTQHPATPLPALLSFAYCGVPAPIRTFEEGAHILVAVRYCILVSLLLLLLLRLATGGTACAL